MLLNFLVSILPPEYGGHNTILVLQTECRASHAIARLRGGVQAVQLAMDRRGRERELTSVLLAGLVPAPLTRDQLALGFTRLLASVEVPLPCLLCPEFVNNQGAACVGHCWPGGLRRDASPPAACPMDPGASLQWAPNSGPPVCRPPSRLLWTAVILWVHAPCNGHQLAPCLLASVKAALPYLISVGPCASKVGTK